MAHPRFVPCREVAPALAISPRSIANLLGLTVAESRLVSLSKLAKVLSADPQWILDCLERRDFAVTELQAHSILGGTCHAKPRAHLKKGRRYSAKDLGLFHDQATPAVNFTGPLSSSPDSNVLGPRGWEQSS